MAVGLLQGKCFAAKTRMRHELKKGDKPEFEPSPVVECPPHPPILPHVCLFSTPNQNYAISPRPETK